MAITVKLEKIDLVNMVLGTTPDYKQMEIPLVNKCGRYTGGFAERWDWSKSSLQELTENQLYDLYKLLTK